jgi:hypothetical protein
VAEEPVAQIPAATSAEPADHGALLAVNTTRLRGRANGRC